jgi:hypothetical protein
MPARRRRRLCVAHESARLHVAISKNNPAAASQRTSPCFMAEDIQPYSERSAHPPEE